MAYRELGVIEVREVLRRFCLGEGLRAIARGTGRDRKTVGKYVAAAIAAGLRRGDAGPTDEHVVAVLAAVHVVPVGRPGDVPDRLAPHRDQIAEGLRLTKIYRRLRAQGVGVPYSSLHRFAHTHLDFGTPAITVRVADPPPGEAAEIDFGLLGLWLDPDRAQRRRVYGLLVTLCYSRYAFLWVSLRQDLAAVLDGLEAAWVFFGGVVRRLVEDNLKPVVTRPDRYAPGIDRVFLEYAQFRGFVVDPAIVRHATGKPKVERGIPYCREDFFRGESFRDVAEMQARAVGWCRDLAGTRVHGTTRQVPRLIFETIEQAALLPLSPEPFDRPTWAEATVHPDHHIQFRRALYSVPTQYIGQRMDIRADSRLVRIYHRHELIKVHPPQPPGGRSTDYTDYPAERTPYALRAPEVCIRQAERVGPAIGQFTAVLLSGTFPWGRLRQAQKLLRLAERYGAARVNAACARVLAFELLDVRRVEKIVRAALERAPGPAAGGAVRPLPARFARAPESFAHHHPNTRRTMMEITPDLVRRLKRLRLGGLLPTLPDRAAHARQAKLSPLEFLELLLQDEIDRRNSQGLALRLAAAGFEELVSYEQIVWDTPVSYDRPRVRDLFTLQWLTEHENVIFCGPVGVGKSFLAQALGHNACRAWHRVRFTKVAKLLQALLQSRADNSFERELRSWLTPDVVILDDFGLRKLTAQQSSDFYDVLVERDKHVATVITSNRAVEEWVALFDDPILANSALDRFAHRAHQIVMEGPSLRAARAPGAAKAGRGSTKNSPEGGYQIWLASSTCLHEPLQPSLSGRGLSKTAISSKRACSEYSRCRKQRTTAGPQGWWNSFENPLGERF